jgi:PAS domain S-box-containing protein
LTQSTAGVEGLVISRKLQRSEEGLLLTGLAMVVLLVFALISGSGFSAPLNPSGFSLLHLLLEMAGVLGCFAVFIVNWEASKQIQSSRSLFVATGFLTVAMTSAMHALSYPGMPDLLTVNSMHKSICYSVASGLLAAGVLLLAAYVRPDESGWYVGRYLLAGASLAGALLVFATVSLFVSDHAVPYSTDYGATSLKAGTELLIIGVNLAAVVVYLRRQWKQRDESVVMLVAALGANSLAHLAFTASDSVFDLFALLGHIYKVVAYYAIFRAMLISSLQRPYVQLTVAKETLEKTVAELDARNRELDALDEVAVSLGGTLKPNEILESAIEKVMVVMRASAGAIFLRNEETDRLKLTAWRGLAQNIVEECLRRPIWAPPPDRPSGDGGEPPDPPGNGGALRRIGSTDISISSLGVCTCAPIRSKGKLLGMMTMLGDEERHFNQRDSDLLTAIAYQLGLAIENAQLYAQTDERLREKVSELQKAERRSRFLLQAGALFGSGADMVDVLAQVARRSVEVLGDWCSIYLLDEQEKLLRLTATYHVDDDELAPMRDLLLRRPVRLGEGIVGRVAERGESVISARVSVEEVASEARYLAQSMEEIATLRSVAPHSRIAVPMRALGRTVGVLLVMATHSRQPLGEEDLSLAIELADRAGAAIETARLFQDIQAQRQHLEAIISQMVDGVVVTDVLGKVLVFNSAAQSMLGERIDQLLGTQSRPAVGPGGENVRGRPSPTLPVPRVLAGGLLLGESLSVTSAGRELALSASAGPVRNEDGEIGGVVVVLRDVTAEREVERIKDEFVATVSHELRTPITAVLGYTDILLRGLRGQLNPKQAEAMNAVRNAGQRLLALINDLLDMSRLEAGKQTVIPTALCLSSCVERAVATVSMLASAKGIVLESEVPDGLPPVLADDELLQRILGNLLSNAIKFTPEGGVVSISAVQCSGQGIVQSSFLPASDWDSGAVAVMVADTGVGIPPEHQARIWDKFQQVDSSSRRMFGGTGLGLSITKGLVELHGGRVWVESEGVPGKGSTFGFTLQTAQPEVE